MQKDTLYKYEIKLHEQKVAKIYKNYKLLLYFALGGISLMFLSLTFLYYVNHVNTKQPDLILSPIFHINTLFILASSISILLAQHHYKKDNNVEFKTSLISWFVFGILFLAGQIIAWILLFNNGYQFTHQSATYLYAVTSFHALHILGGLAFLIYFIYKSWTILKNYATSIVYFTDPVVKAKLNLFAIFWHFLGVMWIYLLIFFIVIK